MFWRCFRFDGLIGRRSCESDFLFINAEIQPFVSVEFEIPGVYSNGQTFTGTGECPERLVRIMKEIRNFNDAEKYAIADRIAGLREKNGYKSMEMAHFMDIHRSTYSDIECGNVKLSTDNLFKICQIFDVSADYILFGKEIDMELEEIRNILEKQNSKRARQIVEGLKMMFD